MRVFHKGVGGSHPLLLASALTLLLAVGCGSNNGNSSNNSSSGSPSFSDALREEAATRSKQAADKVVRVTQDRNLPGGKRYLAVCVVRGEPDAGSIPADAIKCHIEAFYKPYRGRAGGYIWSEDWLVPVQNGKLGTPAILGEYRIRRFLREDNKRNCTGRHRPRECLTQSEGGVLPG
jgi:hypothetical protein